MNGSLPVKSQTSFINGTSFTLDQKYLPLKHIGSGAYGTVCAAIDMELDAKVAIKKISNAFDDVSDATRAIREIKLLQNLQHENVCGMRELLYSYPCVDEIYIVMPHMSSDLKKIIFSSNILTDAHIQYIAYQILRGLKYLHSAKIVHRDIMPSNILINENCDLKICDFGLARVMTDNGDDDAKLTEYVVTRWYRAPEIMVATRTYDEKIDVWSLGCILAELIIRRPLFMGENYVEQIDLILEVLGTPSKDDVQFISNRNALRHIQRKERKNPMDFRKLFPNANPEMLDLMSEMLEFNPNNRIGVDSSLDHQYFTCLRVKETETTCQTTLDFGYENPKLTISDLKKIFLEEATSSISS